MKKRERERERERESERERERGRGRAAQEGCRECGCVGSENNILFAIKSISVSVTRTSRARDSIHRSAESNRRARGRAVKRRDDETLYSL